MLMSENPAAGFSPAPYDPTPPGLIDNHGRRITYLRLAITDRCNLRCRYCRPGKVPFVPHDQILTYDEIERLVRIFTSMGVGKIRITGGEPFARKDCLDLLERLARVRGVEALHLTTNGVAVASHLAALKEIGIAGINLSLDTLDRKKFWAISRRDFFPAVQKTLRGLLASGIPLKINSVVLDDTTDDQIRSLALLAEDSPVTVRFIEKMPFSGAEFRPRQPGPLLEERLREIFPLAVSRVSGGPSTASIFELPGFAGTIGVISGYSRQFCHRCNKVRITPQGMLKNCLYDGGVLDLRTLLRHGSYDDEIREAVVGAIGNRVANGFVAEELTSASIKPSMATIGG